MLLSPVRPSEGKPTSASGFPKAGLCLRIISHQPDSISPDQSPSKDLVNLEGVDKEETPLPSPDPVIIHSQAPLTPDSSPLAGPPPYQPPWSQTVVAADQPSPRSDPERVGIEADVSEGPPSPSEITSAPHSASTNDLTTDAHSAVTGQFCCKVPRTLSAPLSQVASPALGTAQSESPPAAERLQLPEQASALSRDANLDSSAESEDTSAADVS